MAKNVTVEIAPGEQLICFCPEKVAIHLGDRCIVETSAVTESGQILSAVDSSPGDDAQGLPVIVRCETLQDQAKVRENVLLAQIAEESSRKHIDALGLEMRLVQVRYSFDRKLLLVVFAADERIDFRELVKLLAGEFHCRVELRQIGVRDEAGLIGGFGPCGRMQCCTSWLRHFESVNVRMARTQNLSLNPQAISGMCGRLKCCLRYEDDQYKEALRGLPREGSYVEAPDGSGRVVELQILTRKVRVKLQDGRIITYDVSDVSLLHGRPSCSRHANTHRKGEEE